MKVIIAGSRYLNDDPYSAVKEAVAESGFTITTVISGTAQGIDRAGETYGKTHRLPVERYPADWDKYGKSAGYRRNELMASKADALVAVWDGKSRGTMHMIDIMRKLGKPVFVKAAR